MFRVISRIFVGGGFRSFKVEVSELRGSAQHMFSRRRAVRSLRRMRLAFCTWLRLRCFLLGGKASFLKKNLLEGKSVGRPVGCNLDWDDTQCPCECQLL